MADPILDPTYFQCSLCEAIYTHLFHYALHVLDEHCPTWGQAPDNELSTFFKAVLLREVQYETDHLPVLQIRTTEEQRCNLHVHEFYPYLCPFCLDIQYGNVCFEHHLLSNCINSVPCPQTRTDFVRLPYGRHLAAYTYLHCDTKRPRIIECTLCDRLLDAVDDGTDPPESSSYGYIFRYSMFEKLSRWIIMVVGIIAKNKLQIYQVKATLKAIANNVLSPELQRMLHTENWFFSEVASYISLPYTSLTTRTFI